MQTQCWEIRINRNWRLWLSTLLCAACASHPLPPEELAKANLEAMREAVAIEVPDASRAARLNQAIDGMDDQMREFAAAAHAFQENVRALNARPDATRAEFDTLVERFDTQRSTARKRLLELHFDLIAATTDEEWKRLSPYEKAVLGVQGS
jgi:hypothetical protein